MLLFCHNHVMFKTLKYELTSAIFSFQSTKSFACPYESWLIQRQRKSFHTLENLSIQAYSIRNVLYKRWELWWNTYLLWLWHETWWLKSGYIHNLQFSFKDFLPRTAIELFYMSQEQKRTKVLKQNWDDKFIFPACITWFEISKERCSN